MYDTYFLICCSSHEEAKESQKQSNDHVLNDNVPSVTENKKLIVTQEDPHSKVFSKTMNTT